VRQELQIEMDKLPQAGHQEGQVQLAGRADHHPASCPSWQQASNSEVNCCQIVTAMISPEVHFRALPTDPFAAVPLVSSLISFC
jgi:hypothetical protein